jgi:hypothetical protein
LKCREKAECIWGILQTYDFEDNARWKLSFYNWIDDSLICKELINQLKDTVSKMPNKSTIWFRELQRYLKIESDLFQELLKIIVRRNEQENIFIDIDFFEQYTELLKNNIELIKKAYLQQNTIQKHFDFTKKGFFKVLKQDANFLIDYVSSLYSQNTNEYCLDDDRFLNVVWKIDNIESVLVKVFESVNKKEIYWGISEHFCNSFFWNVQGKTKERAKKFLLNYCTANFNNDSKMNIIVDIARHSMGDLYNDILLLFISLTQDVQRFSEIWWRGNGGSYCGDVIIGDIEAAEWRNILSIIEQSSIGIKLLPIKDYVKKQIESALKEADWERKRKFLERS